MTTATPDTVKPKSKLSQHDWDLFRKFVDEFKNESDRAVVILGAAKLDTLLYQLIQRVLKPCTSKADELLDGDSPLSTFSSRISIAHRLHLIDDEFCRALHLIRRIRNSFAHELSGISLNSGAHRDRIRELIAPLKQHEGFIYLLETYFGEKPGPAAEFRTMVALASLRLEGAWENFVLLSRDPYSLVPYGYRRPPKPEETNVSESAT